MLKIAGLIVALCLVVTAQPAFAGTLVTGVIRDPDGAAIPDARVTAFDAAGSIVGTDRTLVDGTFALDASADPATIAIACAYCEPARRAVHAGEPLIAIVRRYNAVRIAGPAPSDIAALPYRNGSDIAGLVPFTVTNGAEISDRALGRTGAVFIDGLPYYRPTNGNDFSNLVPAHAITSVSQISPLEAPLYGSYASAGRFNFGILDSGDTTARVDTGDAFDVVARASGPTLSGAYAASSDAGDERELGAARVATPFAGGNLAVEAITLGDASAHAAGLEVSYATGSRRYATFASTTLTQMGDGSLITADARIRNRGPFGLEFGARAERATGSNPAGTQFDGALYADGTATTGANAVHAVLAVDRGSDLVGPAAAAFSTVEGSLDDELHLSDRWSLHSGALTNLRIPAFVEVQAAAPGRPDGDGSTLFESSLAYTDLRRVRVAAVLYRQNRTGPGTTGLNGLGLEGAWQVAPLLSLRTWTLNAQQSTTGPGYVPPPYVPPSNTIGTRRQLVWLTYGTTFRVDALVRGGALEGDVRIPIGGYAVSFGTFDSAGKRTTTLGFGLR